MYHCNYSITTDEFCYCHWRKLPRHCLDSLNLWANVLSHIAIPAAGYAIAFGTARSAIAPSVGAASFKLLCSPKGDGTFRVGIACFWSTDFPPPNSQRQVDKFPHHAYAALKIVLFPDPHQTQLPLLAYSQTSR